MQNFQPRSGQANACSSVCPHTLQPSVDTAFVDGLTTPQAVNALLRQDDISLVVVQLINSFDPHFSQALMRLIPENGEYDLSNRPPEACESLLSREMKRARLTSPTDQHFARSIKVVRDLLAFFTLATEEKGNYPAWGARLVHSAPELRSRTTTPHLDYFFGIVGIVLIDSEANRFDMTTRFTPDSNVTNREELWSDFESLNISPQGFKPKLADETLLLPAPSQSLLLWRSGPHGRVHAGPHLCPRSRITLLMGG